jgi:N utilization substance protein A
MRGSRIHGIVRELHSENIDIINFTNNTQLLLQRSLTPAKINKIELNEATKHADVYMDTDQVSLAIGRKGVNIKLAQQLTGYEIDVYRDVKETADYDIDLEEFSDEVEDWVIDAFRKIGCDTALSILDLSVEELTRRTDLEEETVREVRRILEAEFEEDGNEA